MNTNRKISALTLAALLSFTVVTAQKADKKEKEKGKDKDKKSQTITIVRSGDADEKITVEVNGDKVTVNGKPVEEYKGDVEVITGSSDVYNWGRPGRLNALKVPSAPMAMSGISGDHFFSVGGNEAVLGVSTERSDDGIKITEVTKESGAEKAGLKEGDIITKIDDKVIEDAGDVFEAISKKKPEDKVTITYKRDGKEQTATATLQKNEHGFAMAMGDNFGQDFNWNYDNGQGGRSYSFSRRPKLGLQVEDLEQGNGVKVLDVNAETPAGKAGLQKDDVITSFNGKEIKGVDDIRNAMRDVKEGESVKVTYQRGGSAQTADIKFPKAVKKASL
jgi:serine protease Do